VRRPFPTCNCVRGGTRPAARPAGPGARQRFLAALSAYSVGVKVADDLTDQHTWKARLAQALYRDAFARSRGDLAADGFDLPAFEAVLADQREIEARGETDLSAASAPSGRAFALAARHLARQHGDGIDPADAFQLGDCIGRSVFLADACQDLERDLRVGAYNPLRPRRDDTPPEDTTPRRSDAAAYLRDLLIQARTVCDRVGAGVGRRWRAAEETLRTAPAGGPRKKKRRDAEPEENADEVDTPQEDDAEDGGRKSKPRRRARGTSTSSSCGDMLAGCCCEACIEAICRSV
ncbi:MAG TPA: DUF5685 family protein, partial [Gemmataceae bacterium]|nr:DUF5685 family protein [Gemmataceae bacterium]